MSEVIDLLPTNGQIDPKVFIYKVITQESKPVEVAVLALNATSARAGIQNRFGPSATVSYMGVCSQLIQVNG